MQANPLEVAKRLRKLQRWVVTGLSGCHPLSSIQTTTTPCTDTSSKPCFGVRQFEVQIAAGGALHDPV
jgi:hypothetical protein